MQAGVKSLRDLQEGPYGDKRWLVLIALQAIDIACKDGAIADVMSGLNPQGCDPRQPIICSLRRTPNGGSQLSRANYCRRYRPPARQAGPVETSTSHVGFRRVVRAIA